MTTKTTTTTKRTQTEESNLMFYQFCTQIHRHILSLSFDNYRARSSAPKTKGIFVGRIIEDFSLKRENSIDPERNGKHRELLWQLSHVEFVKRANSLFFWKRQKEKYDHVHSTKQSQTVKWNNDETRTLEKHFCSLLWN